jgi:hypothetical protein
LNDITSKDVLPPGESFVQVNPPLDKAPLIRVRRVQVTPHIVSYPSLTLLPQVILPVQYLSWHAEHQTQTHPLHHDGMSGSKAALTAINDAIKQNKIDDAIEKAQEFLKKEPKNYQGYAL